MSAEPPRRFARFFACLVKGPLGCLAFVLGAVLVFVGLLPPALGRVLDKQAEDWFAEHHAGELELGDAWLGSLFGEQRVERLILRDPAGEEVLRAALSAPELSQLFAGPKHRYGPVRLRIERLRIVAEEDGTTNLERAFEELPGEPEESGRSSGLATDVPFEIMLEIWITRLRYSSGNGKEEELQNLLFRGTLEWGPDATRLLLEGGADPADTPPKANSDEAEALHARLEYERPEDEPRRSWKSALALEHVPTVLARALCVGLRPLAPLAGARIDHLQWTRDGSEVALACADEGASFELLGQLTEGLVKGSEQPLKVALPCARPSARALLARLLPFVQRLDCEAESALHELRLFAFRWPLDGDWSRLDGELELTLAPGRAQLVPLFPGTNEDRFEAFLGPLPQRLSLREGVLDYAGLQLPLDEGWLALDGQVELVSGASELDVSGELRGEPIERTRFEGQGQAFFPQAPEPPPVEPAQGLPLPPGEEG